MARHLHVCRQTVSLWVDQFQAGGKGIFRKSGRAGRKPELTEADHERLQKLLLQGPEKLGYETPLWTYVRVADLIDQEFGVEFHPGHVWKILDALGWSCQRRAGRACERNEEEIRRWRRVRWPRILKKARKEGRTIVFLDESGISQRPHHVRTWSPRGETPILQHNFRLWSYWKQHALPNVCPKDYWELGEDAHRTLKRRRRRPRLITAFWHQAQLSF